MGEFKKINLVTAIIYTVCLIVAIVMYWFEDDPLGWILIIEFFTLGILIPAILGAVNAVKKGAKGTVFLLPLFFGLGSIACSYFTQNLTWFKNAPDAFEQKHQQCRRGEQTAPHRQPYQHRYILKVLISCKALSAHKRCCRRSL